MPGLDIGKQMAPRHAIAPQLIGHDHPWRILQTLQKSPEEAFGRLAIAPILNRNIEDNAMLIDGTPEIVLYSLDSDKNPTCLSAVAGGSVGDWRKPRRIFCTIAVLSHKRRQCPAQPKAAPRHAI